MNQCSFQRFGMSLDCSRNAVLTVESVKKWVDRMNLMGYNTLMLYTEDTYEIKEEPYFGYLRGRFSEEELREIDDYASNKGIEIIPCIQTLAHLKTMLKWNTYECIHDSDDVMMVGEERTYELIEHMFAAMRRSLKSNIIHIGMDEAHALGRGQYLDKHGRENTTDVLLNHLERVCAIAEKYQFNCIMWSDMFFRLNGQSNFLDDNAPFDELTPEQKKKIPKNLEIVYWDYYFDSVKHYDYQIGVHRKVSPTPWFAGGLWSWMGFIPHNHLSIRNTKAALTSCLKNQVSNVILTSWGDDGGECSKLALLPSMYYSSCLAHGITDENEIKQGFEKLFQIPFDAMMLLDLPGTTHEGKDLCGSPDKYMLYNDCFSGIMDQLCQGNEKELYEAAAAKLHPYVNHPEFGYLFQTAEKMSLILAEKFSIGVDTRALYKAGDKKGLEKILERYELIATRVQEFYDVFEKQWFMENKPFGFEVQDVRLGGLIHRIRHCKRLLRDYLDGKTASIPELEENILPYDFCAPLNENRWGRIFTANVYCV